MHNHFAFGLRWRSALALPFADLQADERSLCPPKALDVTVRFGETPAHLADAAGGTPVCWEAAPGAALLAVPDVARYLVREREIVVELDGGREEDVVTFLAGPAATALLQLRGVATLHAAAIEIGNEAVVLLGVSGAGKSALAAELVARGHALLADNLVGLIASGDRVAVLPAYPRLQLWDDVLPEAEREQPTRPGLKKYWCAPARFATEARPVCAVFLLQSHNQETVDVLPLPGSSAFETVWRHTARRRLLGALGQRNAHYGTAVALARRPFFRVRRPDHPFGAANLADQVAALADRVAALADEIAARHPSAPSAPPAPPGDRCAVPRQRQRPQAGPGSVWAAAEGRGIVWIVAYPKCGTTWLRAVLTNYLQDRDEAASINALVGDWNASARNEFDHLMGIDSSDLRPDELVRYLPRYREALAEAVCALPPANAGSSTGRRYFAKSHEPFEGRTGGPRFSAAGTIGVIYLVRNPLDVAVSYAHHIQAPIEQTIRRMNDPEANDLPAVRRIMKLLPNPLGTWSEHVASWLDQCTVPTCVARYEDLLTDPVAGFGRIVRFTGLEWQPDRLARAVDRAAFRRLRAQEAAHGYGERRQTAPAFFRAGVAGSWRDALTRDQVRALVAAHRPMMARLGYLQEAEAMLAG